MIQRMQLTMWDIEHLPDNISQFDRNYFEFEKVETSLSTAIIAFGYRNVVETGKYSYKYSQWIPILEATSPVFTQEELDNYNDYTSIYLRGKN